MASYDSMDKGKFRRDDGALPSQTLSSPTSSLDNSDTLHGESSPTATRGALHDNVTTSPISSHTEGIDAITESRFFTPNNPYFDDNQASGNGGVVKALDKSQTFSVAPSEPARYKLTRNSLTRYDGGGGFRNSRTWVSPGTQHMHEFTIVRNAMRRLFKNSEVAKWRYADYIAHREAMLASQKNRLSKSVTLKEQELELRVPPLDAKAFATLDALLPNHNLSMEGNRSRVLGLKTIWCVDWENGKEEVAPWPSLAEMKWEGDDRAKTGVGRFLPIPRELGAPTIPWNQLQAIETYDLDKVWPIPQMDDVYLPVDEIDDDVKRDLLNADIEAAIDELAES